MRQAIDRVTQDKEDWDLDHRLLMPDGRVKYVHVVARASRHAAGVEFVGAVMDVTATRRASGRLAGPGSASGARFTAALEERTRLAREIHDTLLQGFTASPSSSPRWPAEARHRDCGCAGKVVGLAQRTLDEAREAIWDLRTPRS